jgi:hypothetical protein
MPVMACETANSFVLMCTPVGSTVEYFRRHGHLLVSINLYALIPLPGKNKTMNFDVSELAQAAAGTLVGLAVTDGWAAVRARLGGIFGHHAGTEIADAVEAEAAGSAPGPAAGLLAREMHYRAELAIALGGLLAESSPASFNQIATAHYGVVMQAGRDINGRHG